MPSMPNLVGLGLAAAQAALQQAGVLIPASLGYFSAYPISAQWVKSAATPGTVTAQSPASGNTVAANSAVTLTVAELPLAVAFP